MIFLSAITNLTRHRRRNASNRRCFILSTFVLGGAPMLGIFTRAKTGSVPGLRLRPAVECLETRDCPSPLTIPLYAPVQAGHAGEAAAKSSAVEAAKLQ